MLLLIRINFLLALLVPCSPRDIYMQAAKRLPTFNPYGPIGPVEDEG
jgi:hypothetical protein